MELSALSAIAEPAYIVAGFTVGLIIGLTGVGGGSLMTPVLMLGFGINPVVAVGTDLAYAAITKCGGIVVHHRRGNIRWKLVGLMAAGSIPASLGAVWVLKSLLSAPTHYPEFLIRATLSVALLLTSAVLLFKPQIMRLGAHESFRVIHVLHESLRTPMTLLCGFIIGALVTLSSVGAGRHRRNGAAVPVSATANGTRGRHGPGPCRTHHRHRRHRSLPPGQHRLCVTGEPAGRLPAGHRPGRALQRAVAR